MRINPKNQVRVSPIFGSKANSATIKWIEDEKI